MSNSLKIVERVRAITETGTDYAVAKALGMNQSNLGRVLKGTNFLGPRAQMEAARLLGIDLTAIAALVNEDKASTDAARSYWRSLCPARVREAINVAAETATALSVAAALIFGPGIPEARAGQWVDHAIHYTYLASSRIQPGKDYKGAAPSGSQSISKPAESSAFV